MLTKFALLAMAFASVSVRADECAGSELLKFTGLLGTSDVTQCKTDSGFAFWQPTGQPDDAQLTLMCKSTACVSLVKSMAADGPSDCTLTVVNSVNLYTLTNSFASDCTRLSGSSTTTPAVTPDPTTVTPATTAPVTTAPATTAPATTVPATTTPATTTTIPAITAPVTTAPDTTAPVTTTPATTTPATTSPDTTAPVTTSPDTTAPATTATPAPALSKHLPSNTVVEARRRSPWRLSSVKPHEKLKMRASIQLQSRVRGCGSRKHQNSIACLAKSPSEAVRWHRQWDTFGAS